MLIFGHTGITLGAAVLLNGALAKRYTLPARRDELRGEPPPSPEKLSRQGRSSTAVSWLISLAYRLDIRLLLIGSLLPDIVDKPIGLFLFRDTFGSGRIFCHTLLFLIVITLVGLYLYRSRKQTRLLVLSFGTFTHLILDAMWRTPRTLLWPLYGLSFERYDLINLSYWIQKIFHTLLVYPAIWITELVGATIVIWFVWLLVRRGSFYAFLRNGWV